MRLCCLALGLPAPPEVHAELEKRSALKALNRTVRETLAAQHYLPLLSQSNKSSWAGAAGSRDDPPGCLERRRELLADKRSFSDSDLSKLKTQVRFLKVGESDQTGLRSPSFPFCPLLKDTGWSPYGSPATGRRWWARDLKRADLTPADAIGEPLSPDDQTREEAPHPVAVQGSGTRTRSRRSRRSRGSFRKPLHKHSSSIEVKPEPGCRGDITGDARGDGSLPCRPQLRGNPRHPNSTAAARLVAKAMAEQGLPGETVLQRSALLQVTGAHEPPEVVHMSSHTFLMSRRPAGGAEQQRLRLGPPRHRVGSSGPQLPLVDLARQVKGHQR